MLLYANIMYDGHSCPIFVQIWQIVCFSCARGYIFTCTFSKLTVGRSGSIDAKVNTVESNYNMENNIILN